MLSPAQRAAVAAAAAALLVVVAVVYLTHGTQAERGPGVPAAGAPPTGPAPVTPAAGFAMSGKRGLMFVDRLPGDHYGELAFAATGQATARTFTGIRCERVYAAAGKVLCLRNAGDAVPSYEAVVLDDRLRTLRTVEVAGLPSRARISADGAIASWTVFVYGDSYTSTAFSTRTSVLDLRSGSLIGSLESFRITKDGAPYAASDVNFWGVTVARDDRTFYATMGTKGQTYLVRGDLSARTVTTVTSNVECPSLSPDGTRIAFKRRVDADGGRKPWHLYVLDLATRALTPLAERNSVDDQAMWLDDAHLAYALPRVGTSTYDVWTVSADGTGQPVALLQGASSPAPVGG